MPSSYDHAVATLTKLGPPTKRAAFSDRMALMLAHLSSLAYIGFENPEESDRIKNEDLDRAVQEILNAESWDAKKKALREFALNSDSVDSGPTDGELERSLASVNLELIKKYNESSVDIQAFLAYKPHSEAKLRSR